MVCHGQHGPTLLLLQTSVHPESFACFACFLCLGCFKRKKPDFFKLIWQPLPSGPAHVCAALSAEALRSATCAIVHCSGQAFAAQKSIHQSPLIIASEIGRCSLQCLVHNFSDLHLFWLPACLEAGCRLGWGRWGGVGGGGIGGCAVLNTTFSGSSCSRWGWWVGGDGISKASGVGGRVG